MPRVGKWLVPQATLMLLLAISSVQAPNPPQYPSASKRVNYFETSPQYPSASKRSRRAPLVFTANREFSKFWSGDVPWEVYTLSPRKKLQSGSMNYDSFVFIEGLAHKLIPYPHFADSSGFRHNLIESPENENDRHRVDRFMEYLNRDKGSPNYIPSKAPCRLGCIIQMFTHFKENDAFEVLTNNTLVHSSPEMLKRQGVANTILAKHYGNTYWMSTTPSTMHKVPHYRVTAPPYCNFGQLGAAATSFTYVKGDSFWDVDPEFDAGEEIVDLLPLTTITTELLYNRL
eukprot:Lankesteria_metandrocarpae@DN5410_c0_g1_i2.p1